MAVWGQIIYEIGGRLGEKVNFRLNLVFDKMTSRQNGQAMLQGKGNVIEVW